MPRGFAAQRAHLVQVDSHPRTNRATGTTAGRYLGDVSPAQAWDLLRQQPEAVLIDIRTRAEWAYVGGPDLASLDRDVVQVEWQTFPHLERNPRFLRELQAQGLLPGRTLYLLCRSGIRSRAAAEFLAERGYQAYNVTDGFEGPIDSAGHRSASGWRAAGLPWKQS